MILVIALNISFLVCSTTGQDGLSLKEQMFRDTDKLFEQAISEQANLLSHSIYQRAQKVSVVSVGWGPAPPIYVYD